MKLRIRKRTPVIELVIKPKNQADKWTNIKAFVRGALKEKVLNTLFSKRRNSFYTGYVCDKVEYESLGYEKKDFVELFSNLDESFSKLVEASKIYEDDENIENVWFDISIPSKLYRKWKRNNETDR